MLPTVRAQVGANPILTHKNDALAPRDVTNQSHGNTCDPIGDALPAPSCKQQFVVIPAMQGMIQTNRSVFLAKDCPWNRCLANLRSNS